MEHMPDDLQAKIDAYNANFERIDNILGEDSITESGIASEVRIEKTKEILTESLPVAVRGVVALATSAVSETVRLSACKTLLEYGLGKDANVGEEDAATKLLRRISVQAEVGSDGEDEQS